jgi:hypothetical protein
LGTARDALGTCSEHLKTLTGHLGGRAELGSSIGKLGLPTCCAASPTIRQRGFTNSCVALAITREGSRTVVNIPGVQTPHCKAWCLRKAVCSGLNASSLDRPSMVTMLAPSACTVSIRQVCTAAPSTMTVHAPQVPCSRLRWGSPPLPGAVRANRRDLLWWPKRALLTEEPDADAGRIRSALSNNLCRYTGHILYVAAVLEARSAYRKADTP